MASLDSSTAAGSEDEKEMKKFLTNDLCIMLAAAIFGIILLFISMCSKVDAAEIESLTVGYAPFCYHWDRDKEYNEDNNHGFLLAATIKDGPFNRTWRPFVLTFRNSYYDRAVAGGLVFRTEKWKPFDNDIFFRANLLVGIIHGYGDRFTLNIGGIAPIAAPTGEIGYKDFSAHLMATPAVASLMLTYKYDFLGR